MKTLATASFSLLALATWTPSARAEPLATALEKGSGATPALVEETHSKAPGVSASDSAVHGQELMFNAFRAPSMGLEYRVGRFSVHAGAYTTVINEGDHLSETAEWFAKAGANLWLFPIRMLDNERSSFYAGVSYLNDFDRHGWGHTAQVEGGFRLVIYEGLFARLGASALYAPGRSCASDDCETLKIRPNPGIGWAIGID